MMPNGNYMVNQRELDWNMRKVLIDWIVQVHATFRLLPETLYLTVNIIDRFLTVRNVPLFKFQLVGATALLIASKYEEITCPSVQEIVWIVESAYPAEEILEAERFMVNMLQFELGWPGPMSFLRRISKADDYDVNTRTLAKYLLEVALHDYHFVASPPSFMAAVAHALARRMLSKGIWVHLSSLLQVNV
jgi:G2/mitotic-specific cyclin 3/4